jgi:uncharacterized protein (DUF697 family)
MPEGLQAAKADVGRFKLNSKRVLAHGIVGTLTASAAVVGAVPIPFADALLLVPIETAMVTSLAKVYGINKGEGSKQFINAAIQTGTVGAAAKLAISALKAVPGVNLAAATLNAVIAGCIAAALGEGTIYAFEQVYLGKKSVADVDWLQKLLEERLATQFIDKAKAALAKINKDTEAKDIAKNIVDIFASDA